MNIALKRKRHEPHGDENKAVSTTKLRELDRITLTVIDGELDGSALSAQDTPPGTSTPAVGGVGATPETVLGAHPKRLVATGVAQLSDTIETVRTKSVSMASAASVPTRLAAFGSLSGHVAKITVAVGELAASTVRDIGGPANRSDFGYADAYEDAV